MKCEIEEKKCVRQTVSEVPCPVLVAYGADGADHDCIGIMVKERLGGTVLIVPLSSDSSAFVPRDNMLVRVLPANVAVKLCND